MGRESYSAPHWWFRDHRGSFNTTSPCFDGSNDLGEDPRKPRLRTSCSSDHGCERTVPTFGNNNGEFHFQCKPANWQMIVPLDVTWTDKRSLPYELSHQIAGHWLHEDAQHHLSSLEQSLPRKKPCSENPCALWNITTFLRHIFEGPGRATQMNRLRHDDGS